MKFKTNSWPIPKPGAEVQKFSAKCRRCGSEAITLRYEFNYYGGMTGYDQSLEFVCDACGAREPLSL